MSKEFDVGMNKTGIAMSPVDKRQMLENTEVPPGSGEDLQAFIQERRHYIQESGPIGTVPPPATLKGVAKSALQSVSGNTPTVFIDKLGARLAFERTGTRLYEGFIHKLEVLGSREGIPEPDLVQQFYREELSHMELVRQCIEELGADPTAITPSANVDGVASFGLLQVITDPRTDIAESLHAIHIAELADNDGWETLVQMAQSMGMDEIAQKFQKALEEEMVHLQHVRQWMTGLVMAELKK